MSSVFQALRYIEVISHTVLLNPGLYSAVLVRQLYELGNRLKYHDPLRLQSGEEFTDPQWLTQLAVTAQALEVSSRNPYDSSIFARVVNYNPLAVAKIYVLVVRYSYK